MAEQQPLVPIVEHLPNGDNPHPSLEGAPQGTLGHADEAFEHKPIEHDGKIIAAPEGHNVQVTITPSEEQVEKMLKESTEDSERWRGEQLKRNKEKAELPKAA